MEKGKRQGVKDWQVNRRIGNAVFQLAFVRQNAKVAIDKRHMNILHSEDWIIVKYSQEGWKEIFSFMEVCYAKKLWIGMTYIPNIINHISKTAFMGLLQLHLCNHPSIQPTTK